MGIDGKGDVVRVGVRGADADRGRALFTGGTFKLLRGGLGGCGACAGRALGGGVFEYALGKARWFA